MNPNKIMQSHLLEELRAKLRALNLEHHEARFLPHVRLAFDLRLSGESSGKVGESRWGGAPDVPDSFEWPQNGKFPMDFLVQINLKDLIANEENPFPASGLLQFFGDYESNACLVVLHPSFAEFRAAQVPASEGESLFADIEPQHLTLVARADLPQWATNDEQELMLHLSEEEQDVYKKLSPSSSYARTPGRETLAGQLLGHASGIGVDPREDAFVVREHNPAWMYQYEQRAKLDMSGAKRWQNLLRFDSVGDLCIGDAGYLVFLAHEDDLKRLDFSRVYGQLESS